MQHPSVNQNNKPNLRNLLFTLRYDGSAFHGWQIQHNAVTVQQVFQEAVAKIIGSCPDIKGCSRTDSGVHANMFCLSMKTDHPIPCERFMAAVNSHLPMEVAVTDVREVPLDFHARYNAKGKRYIYKIHNSQVRDPFLRGRALYYRRPIDVDKLSRAAKDYIGAHDFTSFCTLDKREAGDFVRTVSDSRVWREGDMVYFSVTADGFLYNMVRIMVGTLIYINEGGLPSDAIPSILKACDRSKAGPTAPACGLYLDEVFYDFK
ncbi:MAG: tRNA pseudouridine(38-40) synthase TruA [Ruminococcaceae bacterium]|nr:tRNA pseudouridine(38-40) synthase TruA [Oscillospiraceae bacterium]